MNRQLAILGGPLDARNRRNLISLISEPAAAAACNSRVTAPIRCVVVDKDPRPFVQLSRIRAAIRAPRQNRTADHHHMPTAGKHDFPHPLRRGFGRSAMVTAMRSAPCAPFSVCGYLDGSTFHARFLQIVRPSGPPIYTQSQNAKLSSSFPYHSVALLPVGNLSSRAHWVNCVPDITQERDYGQWFFGG